MDFHSFDESGVIPDEVYEKIAVPNKGSKDMVVEKANLVDPAKDPDPTEKVNFKELGAAFTTGNLSEMPEDIVDLAKKYGKEYRAIKAAEAAIKKRTEALAEQGEILFAMLENIGISSFKSEGRTYFTRIDMYASVDSGNEAAAFKWVDGIGCDYLIARKINAKSLTREIKAYVEGGGDMPGIKEGIKINTVNRFCAPRT